ncbi:MAG TPA: DEAD/DEAH box helicase, partial [Dyadobacter sp.]|nr:DEAD/DEAH box helicase [Dyadobacter sp.]
IKFDHKPKKGYTKPFQAASSELGLSFTLTKQEACYRLQLHVLKDTNPLDYYELFPARSPLFVFDKRSGTYLIAPTLRDIDLITSLTITGQVLTVMDIHFEHFNKSVLQFLTRHYPFQYDSVGADQRTLQVQQMQLRIFEHAGSFCFQPQVDYGQELLVPTLSGGTSWIEIHGQPVIFIRDKAKEAALSELVRLLHTDFASQACKNEDYFSLPKTTILNTGCLPDMLSKLKENQITVTGIEDIEALADYLNLVDIRMGIHADKDWFEITLKATCSQISISSEVLRHAILENDGQLTLKDGTRATIPASWQKKLKTVMSFSQPLKSGMRLSGFHAQLLDQLNGHHGLRGFAQNLKSHAPKVKVITNRQVPDNVRATLRAYQKEGFDWLMFLKDNCWGGILADDMGLGKTLQVLILLQNVYRNGLHTRPSLLIVPTSLLFNWQQEAEKFTPDLRIVRYHGAFRQQQASRLDSGDVILTTYKTVLHDIDILRHAQFEYVILDEAQAIKNQASQRYKAVSILDARTRLAMTGTPVENSGNDLYALMNFVNPGMLGSLRGFNKLLANKAETDAVSYLQKIISTFILRRTKQQVAKDLPEKTEMVIYCEMETQQRAVYEAYRTRYQKAIREKINETGAVNSKLYALAGLLKLRQICNAPVLVEAQVKQEAEPAKIKELMRRLKEITPFHKVLVFSSFTGFLGLIRQQLEKSHLGYAYLDGKTKEDQRRKMVDLFQNDDHTRVFLISLKAGGTGLNLTAAEYVFLVDPWWNPAAESQAIDRCYRIGQKNNVMAYRMICKDTLEEKILNMQAQKRQLADELVSSTDGVLKSLSAEDVLELFS